MNRFNRNLAMFGLLAAMPLMGAAANAPQAAQAAPPAAEAQTAKPAKPAKPTPEARAEREARVRDRVIVRTSSMGGTYLGVDTQEVTAERVAALKLREERGVEITMVDQDAPAGKAGLKEHDVITEFNGTRVESVEQLRRLIREIPAGRQVTLGIMRNGSPINVQATLAQRPGVTAGQRIHLPDSIEIPEMPEMPDVPTVFMVSASTMKLGVQVESLTPQLGQYFGVKDGDGVLVRSVEKGSAAETAGMKAGDVIIRVGNEKVQNRSDLRRALRQGEGTAPVNVTVIREKREVVLPVTLPKSKERGAVKVPEFDFDFDFDFDMDFEGDAPELHRMLRDIERSVHQSQMHIAQLQPHLERQLKVAFDRDKVQREVGEAMQRAEKTMRELELF